MVFMRNVLAKHSYLNLSRNCAEKYQSVTRSIWSLLDLSKAFDKVNHLKLLFKLSTHGIEMLKRPAIPWSQKCIYVYWHKCLIKMYLVEVSNEAKSEHVLKRLMVTDWAMNMWSFFHD